jgi:hypothetical protein
MIKVGHLINMSKELVYCNILSLSDEILTHAGQRRETGRDHLTRCVAFFGREALVMRGNRFPAILRFARDDDQEGCRFYSKATNVIRSEQGIHAKQFSDGAPSRQGKSLRD